jgi:hypothetical protein
MTITAHIHGETPTSLPADAVLLVEGATYPIPADGASIFDRVSTAVEAAGYCTDGDYHGALGPLDGGVREIRLVKA